MTATDLLNARVLPSGDGAGDVPGRADRAFDLVGAAMANARRERLAMGKTFSDQKSGRR